MTIEDAAKCLSVLPTLSIVGAVAVGVSADDKGPFLMVYMAKDAPPQPMPPMFEGYRVKVKRIRKVVPL